MSIREAIYRFREIHQEFKNGAYKSPEARGFYERERDDFVSALVLAQQLTRRPGQSPRQALRVTREERLVLKFGPRREGTLTLDVGSAGFCASVGPLALRIPCEFELGSEPNVVRGVARVVASVRGADGSYRTSFAIETMADEDRVRLETAVLDAALAAFSQR